MRYFALACDYDGTIAHEGVVAPSTIEALQRLKESGRRPILVTGRQLEELLLVFPEFAIFDRIVADNGAVLFLPLREKRRFLPSHLRPNSQKFCAPAAYLSVPVKSSSEPLNRTTRSSSKSSRRWASSFKSSTTKARS